MKAVENWAESAITDAPQTSATIAMKTIQLSGKKPMNRAAPPLMAIAQLATIVRP